MIALDLPSIKDASLTVDADYEGDRIVLALRGNADMRVVDHMDSYFPGLHAEAQRRAIKRVEVDIRQLEFMNSSCFKSLITWIGTVSEMPESERYCIHFIPNPEFHWQRRSLRALQGFAEDLVTIEP